MCLYKVSWTPLTPINVSGAKEKITNKSKNSTHVAICFIKNDEEILLNSPYSSDWCLCIESYRCANYHHQINSENVCFFCPQEQLPRVPEREQQSPVGSRLHHQLSLDPRSGSLWMKCIFKFVIENVLLPTLSN